MFLRTVKAYSFTRVYIVSRRTSTEEQREYCSKQSGFYLFSHTLDSSHMWVLSNGWWITRLGIMLFNCTAGIRRHIEQLVELKAEHMHGVLVEWDVVLSAIARANVYRVRFMNSFNLGSVRVILWMSQVWNKKRSLNGVSGGKREQQHWRRKLMPLQLLWFFFVEAFIILCAEIDWMLGVWDYVWLRERKN